MQSFSALASSLRDNSDDSIPTSTKVGIAALVVFSLLALVRVWYYGCRRAPVQGSAIGRPRRCFEGRVMAPMVLFVLVLVSFVLRLVALGVDQWGMWRGSYLTYYYGLFALSADGHRFSYHFEGTAGNVVFLGSILTLISGVLSLVFSFVLLVTLLQMRSSPSAVSLRAEKAYRIAGNTANFTSTAFSVWMLVVYVYYNDEANARVGASAWLFLVSMVLDSIVGDSCKAILLNTVPFHALAGEAGVIGILATPGYVPPQQVVYATPVYQQPPPAYHQPPQAYHQPPQAYHQPAPAYGYGQPQQQPLQQPLYPQV